MASAIIITLIFFATLPEIARLRTTAVGTSQGRALAIAPITSTLWSSRKPSSPRNASFCGSRSPRARLRPLARLPALTDLNLARNRQGANNWQDLGGGTARADAPAADAGGAAAPTDIDLNVEAIVVDDARIVWNDAVARQHARSEERYFT